MEFSRIELPRGEVRCLAEFVRELSQQPLLDMSLVHRFAPGGGLIRLRCREHQFDDATIRNIRLTAIRVSLP